MEMNTVLVTMPPPAYLPACHSGIPADSGAFPREKHFHFSCSLQVSKA